MKSFLILFVCLLFCLSCGSRQDTIDDLRTLVEDIRLNGAEYTAEQWADAEGIYAEVCDELDQNEYTPAEKEVISKLKGEYLAAIAQWKVQDRFGVVKDIVDQVKGAGESILKGLNGDEKENEK